MGIAESMGWLWLWPLAACSRARRRRRSARVILGGGTGLLTLSWVMLREVSERARARVWLPAPDPDPEPGPPWPWPSLSLSRPCLPAPMPARWPMDLAELRVPLAPAPPDRGGRSGAGAMPGAPADPDAGRERILRGCESWSRRDMEYALFGALPEVRLLWRLDGGKGPSRSRSLGEGMVGMRSVLRRAAVAAMVRGVM